MRTALRSLIPLWAALALAPVAATAAPAATAFDGAVAEAKAAMMADPEHALAKSEVALARARALPPSRAASIAIATAEWLEAESYIGANRLEDATPIVARALQTVELLAPTSKLHGDLLRSRGAIAAMSGHVEGALTDFQRAFRVFHGAGEMRSQAITLQDIGQIYWDADDYTRTLQYYSQAGELYKDDPAFTLTSHNNRAQVLRKLGRPAEAVAEYSAALQNARALKSPLLEVRILSNLAAAQVEMGQPGAADRTIFRALDLSQAGEAAGWKPFVLGAAAQVALARKDLPRAAALLQQTFAGADLTRTPMPFREFHETAATVYDLLGQHDLAYAHLRAFQRLDGEARNLTASTSSQLMSARFDFTNQNLKISQLKQVQLARDIRFRTILFTALGIAGAVVFGVLLIGFLSIRRSRNEVRATNAVLTTVNTKLEKALHAKTEFLATTSHEIRTPLNGILGMTQILLANRRVEGEMREQVQVVHGAGEAMRALVDDILDVAKMETGEVSIVREEANLAGILNDAVTLWRGQAQTKGIAITRGAGTVPPRILSDEARLRQIVSNLMSNAVKFTLVGGVELTADVAVVADREMLVIRVADTGIGIAEEQHELIFEAFRQADGGTTRQFGGTGLGLTISRRLAAAMGGTITLDSALGRGATFTLTLPLERPAAPAVVAGEVGGSTLATATLLLVERNALTQSIMRAVLGPAVAAIEMASDGLQAADIIRDTAISHVLIEANSVADGGEEPHRALRDLVTLARERDIHCSILFTPGDSASMADMLAIGATQIIAKPIDAARLVAELGAVYAPDAVGAAFDTVQRSAA